MSGEGSRAVDVFFSYAHEDEELRDELARHLKLLERRGKIRGWHDRRIAPGEEWAGKIDDRLESARLILLLVSSSFLASDYCWDVETARALERHEAGEARVVPIVLRPCDWTDAPFGKLQALPKDANPVTSWENRDEAFLDVARGIRRVIEALQATTPAAKDDRPEPLYPDLETRELSEKLKDAHREKALLEADGEDATEVTEEILGLKRRMREGAQLRPGDLLAGQYELIEPIGRGGFARVWKAYDRDRRVTVAVKVLHPQFAEDKTRRDRFFRGARQMARLRHPGVVAVLEEEAEDGGYHFFVMEYVAGGDLRREVLAGNLSTEERLRVVLEVGEALRFAHEQGVVHRDVKPANVLLDLAGRPKLTDFDLVRAADSTGGTRTSSMLGTFVYAAPEAMLNAKKAAEPADVYSLGMTALFALHGAELPPHVLWELPEFLDALDVDEVCREVLSRAVARKVVERWGTVGEFCGALRGVLEAVEETPRVTEPRAAVRVVEPSPRSPDEPPAGEPIREWVNEKDGSVLVFVPGDEYVLGADDITDEEKPVHTVRLSPFWIGKYPVTNAQYRRFLEANPDREKPKYWDDKRFNDPEQPVVGVDWLEALAYCRWAGLELPSEAQWEAAARGTAGRAYPWGDDDPTPELANFDRRKGRPTPVGAYPRGSGPYGALDQAGNVWEWCRDPWNPKAYEHRDGEREPEEPGKSEGDEGAWRVVRGGSWSYPSRFLRAAFRSWVPAWSRSELLGFRVLSRVGPEHGD